MNDNNAVNIIKNQIIKLNEVVAGLEDKSKLSYPDEYDHGRSLLKEVESDLKKAKRQLSDSAFISWFSSRL